jgi:hypothetical protein
MPGLRVEVTERLVLHLIELGKQLCDQPIWAAMVGKEIVSYAVAPRARSPINERSILILFSGKRSQEGKMASFEEALAALA